jgi:hypothetical protein
MRSLDPDEDWDVVGNTGTIVRVRGSVLNKLFEMFAKEVPDDEEIIEEWRKVQAQVVAWGGLDPLWKTEIKAEAAVIELLLKRTETP